MKTLTYFLVIAFLCISATTQNLTAVNNSSEFASEYLLESANDTVWFSFQGEVGSFTLSATDSVSYFRLPQNDTLLLYSGDDTLIIIPQLTAPPIRMKFEKYDRIAHVEFPLSISGNLQKHSVFGNSVPTNMPSFIYSPPTDTGLTRLRNIYALDSVTGEKNEIEQIISLLKWSHHAVRHDGSVNPVDPKERNALTILDACRTTNRGVNCRMMATLLNEVFLAMGFKSRHITCMPKDKEDPDCHVINIVYSDSLEKWLYMDPTFQAYLMDSAGNILNVEEVREMF
ncbi:MAG: transglutaminase domain-containing protein, partial [Candidatus Zixiibacteriota bacterium]